MTDPTPQQGESRAWRLGMAGLAAALLLLPFLFATWPPATDLPQHLAQIHLLQQVLDGHGDLYTINWFAPNNLIYVPVAAAQAVFTAPLSGKVVMLVLVLMWVGTLHLVAARLNRPLAGAVLVTPLVFNLSFYWGFLNFLVGWPFFLLLVGQGRGRPGLGGGLVTLLLLMLLYASHALWFVVGCLYLVAVAWLHRDEGRRLVLRLWPVLPVGLLSLFWYRGLSASRQTAGFDTAPHWDTMPWERLAPARLVDALLGGIKGPVEPLLAVVLLAWVAAALITNRGRLKEAGLPRLLAGAGVFGLIFLVAPDRYMNTIYFAQRWFPCAVTLLVVGLPVPALPRPAWHPRLLRGVVLLVVLLFSLGTARTWRQFDRQEMSGLAEALQRLPRQQMVLTLDLVKASDYLKGRPFVQTGAYAQVLDDATIGFSFAEHYSGIVSYREKRNAPWTPGLEWFAERAKGKDFTHFDYVLVNADAETHAQFQAQGVGHPLTSAGRWRLYQVDPRFRRSS